MEWQSYKSHLYFRFSSESADHGPVLPEKILCRKDNSASCALFDRAVFIRYPAFPDFPPLHRERTVHPVGIHLSAAPDAALQSEILSPLHHHVHLLDIYPGDSGTFRSDSRYNSFRKYFSASCCGKSALPPDDIPVLPAYRAEISLYHRKSGGLRQSLV